MWLFQAAPALEEVDISIDDGCKDSSHETRVYMGLEVNRAESNAKLEAFQAVTDSVAVQASLKK